MADVQEAARTNKPAAAMTGAQATAANLLARTPDQILGPFYPISLKPVTTGDLTKNGRAEGQVLYVTGRVMSMAGKPVAGAEIEVWQANTHGRYRHPNDSSDQPLDPNFSGYAVLTTGRDGRYRLKTVKSTHYETSPGNYRPAHIHFIITSKREKLTTQMYFEGDPYNATDPYLNSARRQDGLVRPMLDPAEDMESGSKRVEFDIVLMKG